jgi:hypothetical protein
LFRLVGIQTRPPSIELPKLGSSVGVARELKQANAALQAGPVGQGVGGEFAYNRGVLGLGKIEQRTVLKGCRGAKSLRRLRIGRVAYRCKQQNSGQRCKCQPATSDPSAHNLSPSVMPPILFPTPPNLFLSARRCLSQCRAGKKWPKAFAHRSGRSRLARLL